MFNVNPNSSGSGDNIYTPPGSNNSNLNFPPNPNGPASGSINWSFDYSDLYNDNLQSGPINVFANFAIYLSAHPESWTAMLDMTRAYATLVAHYGSDSKAMSAIHQYLGQDGSWALQLMQSGLEVGAEFAFKNGYEGATGEDAYKAFLSQWQSALQPFSGDSIISPLLGTIQYDLNNADEYTSEHTDPTTGQYGVDVQLADGTYMWFDYTNKDGSPIDPNQEFTIDMQLLFGAPTNAISNLQQNINSLKEQDVSNTLNNALKHLGPGGVIILILILMMGTELGSMNQISGNNDIANNQNEFNQRFVSEIGSSIDGIGSWNGSNPSASDQQQAGQLRTAINELMANQAIDPQFQSLNSTMDAFKSFMQTNNIIWTDPKDGKTSHTASLWDLMTSGKYDNQELAAALKQGLAPSAPSSSGVTPGSAASPNAQQLQGFLGSVNAFTSTFQSTSTQLATISSQIQQVLLAAYKMATDGAISTTSGLNAVTQTAVNKSSPTS